MYNLVILVINTHYYYQTLVTVLFSKARVGSFARALRIPLVL